MKLSTMLLVAGAFAAGIAFGMMGPLAKAGTGLTGILTEAAPMPARTPRITATTDAQRDGLQLVDFRWNAHAQAVQSVICSLKDQPARAQLPDIQHL